MKQRAVLTRLKIYIVTLVTVVFALLLIAERNVSANEQQSFFNQNIDKLTEFVSETTSKSLGNISPQEFPPSFSSKKLQEFIYLGTKENYVHPDKDNINDIESIKLIYDDESTETVASRIMCKWKSPFC